MGVLKQSGDGAKETSKKLVDQVLDWRGSAELELGYLCGPGGRELEIGYQEVTVECKRKIFRRTTMDGVARHLFSQWTPDHMSSSPVMSTITAVSLDRFRSLPFTEAAPIALAISV